MTFDKGSRVRHLPTGRVGTVLRVIARDGALGGLADVRWDGSRRHGFEAGNELAEVSSPVLRHKDGFVTFG